MTDITGIQAADTVATYLGRGDPAGRFAGYYPAWFDKLAADHPGGIDARRRRAGR